MQAGRRRAAKWVCTFGASVDCRGALDQVHELVIRFELVEFRGELLHGIDVVHGAKRAAQLGGGGCIGCHARRGIVRK